jgi:sporulation protein YlmC with PRC-barrel domain
MFLYIFTYRKIYKELYFYSHMLKIKRLSEIIGKRVYTDSGDFFGEIEEANLMGNRVDSWRIRIESGISSFLGGAKGVVIPNQFVKAIGDICIVSRANLPLEERESFVEEDSFEEEEIEL